RRTAGSLGIGIGAARPGLDAIARVIVLPVGTVASYAAQPCAAGAGDAVVRVETGVLECTAVSRRRPRRGLFSFRTVAVPVGRVALPPARCALAGATGREPSKDSA